MPTKVTCLECAGGENLRETTLADLVPAEAIGAGSANAGRLRVTVTFEPQTKEEADAAVCALDIGIAAHALWNECHREPWFVCVGEGKGDDGKPAIVLHVSGSARRVRERFRGGWHGHAVRVENTGRARPA